MQNTDVRRGRHCVFMMHVHLVFVTKYRCARFSADQLGFLKDIFEGICKDFNAELVEMNGERDHVHLLVNYPPNVSVSKLVNSLKGVSSSKGDTMQNTDVRRGRHCVFMMHVHLVFVTKYRCARFSADQLGFLKDIFEGICKDFNAELVEMNGERDHVHLLVNYPPNVSVSKLVNSLKGVSSRMLRKQSQAGFERCFGSCLWSPSYFAASCGGAPLSIIKTYIENQETPD